MLFTDWLVVIIKEVNQQPFSFRLLTIVITERVNMQKKISKLNGLFFFFLWSLLHDSGMLNSVGARKVQASGNLVRYNILLNWRLQHKQRDPNCFFLC